MTAGPPDLTPPDSTGRKPPAYSTSNVTATNPWGRWYHQRTVDPVKACALRNAVDLLHSFIDVDGLTSEHAADQALQIAKAFEVYLDPSVARPPGHGAAPDTPEGR